ncbi:MAG TPA: hypothetical protein VF143_07090 [Candidatus Nanopelagicales bacterium]
MGHPARSVASAGFVATLDVEGRGCDARPLRGSGLGHVCGPVLVVRSVQALSLALPGLPGRVLVLDEAACAPAALADLARLPTGAFAAIVALTDDMLALGESSLPQRGVPAVAVLRSADRDLVRRAIRVCVGVHERAPVAHPVPAPRRPRRRHLPVASPSAVPGTIDLRAQVLR